MGNKPCKLSGTFFNCISIDRNYNNQQYGLKAARRAPQFSKR